MTYNLSQMKVAVVDDHDLIREGLNVLLANQGVEHIDKYSTANELVSILNAGTRHDFYIIDLGLPDLDGFTLIKMIRAHHPASRIIACTIHDEIWTLRKLLACKVNAIIYKSGNSNEIITAMNEILADRVYYCEAAQKALRMAGDDSLHPSTREQEVLYLISAGKTTKEIAAELFVSENTVEAHRKSLFQKLNAINVADLVIKAVEKGYIKTKKSE